MSKINSAESIRGIACLVVVISHLTLIFFPLLHNFENVVPNPGLSGLIYNSPFTFLFSGTSAVFIFFVLSGYVLSYAILGKNNVNQKLVSMSIKRYPRLGIPALASCILVYIILSFVSIDTSALSAWIQSYGENTSFFNALYQGTIGAFIFGQSSLNFVLWTMQIELFASFLVFFLIYVYANKSIKLFYSLSILIPVACLVVSQKMALGMFSFIAGMFLYLYGNKIPSLLAIPSLILGLYFAGIHTNSSSYELFNKALGSKSYTLLNFLSGILITYGVIFNQKVSNFLDKKYLVTLGKLSFSIYLIHVICIYVIAVPLFNFFFLSLNYVLSALLASLIAIISTIFLSSIYCKYIDELSIKVANKIESKVLSILKNKSR